MIGKRTTKGFSLLELVFASGILLTISITLIALYLNVITRERTNIKTIRMAYDSANLHREMRKIAAIGGTINVDNDTITFTNTITGTTSLLTYVDEDGDNDTIGDNYMELIPDVNDNTAKRTVVRYGSRLTDPDNSSQFLPIFSRLGNFRQPIIIEFRIGDRVGIRDLKERANDDKANAEDALTGKGFQSLVFRGAYGPRNT